MKNLELSPHEYEPQLPLHIEEGKLTHKSESDRERRDVVALGDALEKHPLLEAGREKAAEFIKEHGIKNVVFLGVGNGREAEVVAEQNSQLENVTAYDWSFKEQEGDDDEKRKERDDKRSQVEEKIRKANANCKIEVKGANYNDKDFKIPEGLEVAFMAVTFHDQSLSQQKELLKKLKKAGVKNVVFHDVYVPEEVGPNYRREGESEEEFRSRMTDEIEKFYINWLRPLESNLKREDFRKYAKAIKKAKGTALSSIDVENEAAENFDTVNTISEKMEEFGYKLKERHDVEDNKYLKTLIFELKD